MRRLLYILGLLISTSAFAQNGATSGTKVASPFIKNSVTDNSATGYANLIAGGYHTTPTKVGRDSLLTNYNKLLVVGMQCYVSSEDSTYRWNGTTWLNVTPQNASLVPLKSDTSTYLLTKNQAFKKYKQLGTTIYDKAYFTNYNDFTAVGFTPTIVNNSIEITGGAGATNYSQYLQLKNAISSDENVQYEVKFKVVATGSGIGIGGFGNQASCYSSYFEVFLNTSTNTLTILTIPKNCISGGIMKTFTLPYSIVVGDYIRLRYTQFENDVNATIEDLSKAIPTYNSIQFSIPLQNTALVSVSSIRSPAVYNHGGTYDIEEFKVTSATIREANIVVIGNSKANNMAQYSPLRISNLLGQLGTVQNMSANSALTADFLAEVPYIISLAPKNVIVIDPYRNDIGGIATATWQASISAFYSQLTAAGIKVIFLIGTDETVINQTIGYNFITSNFPPSNIINVLPGWVIATMVGPDNVHLTVEGMRYVASQIVSSGLFPLDSRNDINIRDYLPRNDIDQDHVVGLTAALAAKGPGTVTNVSSPNTDIVVTNGTTTPSINLTNVNGITTAYYDPISSIQTQLNGKQASITLSTTGTSGVASFSSPTLTIPQVLPTVLSTYALGTNTAITTADNITQAFGKAQAQINANAANFANYWLLNGNMTSTGVNTFNPTITGPGTGNTFNLNATATGNSQTFTTLIIGAPNVTTSGFTNSNPVALTVNGVANFNNVTAFAGIVSFNSTVNITGVASTSTLQQAQNGVAAISVATQRSSTLLSQQLGLWGGSAQVNLYNIIQSVASTTVGMAHRLSFVTGSTTRSSITGGIENMTLYSSGNVGIGTGTTDLGVLLGIAAGSSTLPQLKLLTSVAVTPSSLTVGGHWFDSNGRLNVINTSTTSQQYAWTTDFKDNRLSKTASYTILGTDFIVGYTLDLEVDATSGAITITLPSAATYAGYTIYITKMDAGANVVTIAGSVVGTTTLATQYQSRTFKSDGTNWSNR